MDIAAAPRTATEVDYLAVLTTQVGQYAAIREVLNPAVVECTDASCGAATSHRETCECSCLGDGHGREHRVARATALAQYKTRVDRAGGVMAQLAAAGGLGDPHDGWWNEGPATVPAVRRELPDFDDPCWD